MDISGDLPNGIKFIGSKGSIFVTRDGPVTPSDPTGPRIQSLVACDPKILDSVIGPNEIHLYASPEQHANWLDSMRTRAPNAAPVEVGHRACSTCLIHSIAMHVKRKVYWDPVAERFKNDDEANAMLSRPQRVPYTFG